jgi:nitric oxide reductase NorD protein
LGDRIRVLAFSSETRNRCHVWDVLGWDEPWQAGRARLGALEPTGYTRIGPAIRHATADLAAVAAERKLLLLVSDGKPTDFDRYEGRYGIADVRQSLREAEQRGLRAHALAVDAVAREWLPALFGAGAWHVLPRPDLLADVLTEVYGRLTLGSR